MPNCLHKNIHWEDLFKLEKQNNYQYRHQNAYCVDCQADKGKLFATACQIWYVKKVKEWLRNNNLSKCVVVGDKELHTYLEFDEFVKKNNFEEQWKKLCLNRVDDNEGFESFIGQGAFWETARSIEHLCYEFKKEKERPNDRERERENKFAS